MAKTWNITNFPELTFSKIIEQLQISQRFEKLTARHPFYSEVGLGTLPLDKFKGMIQQDDLYVRNYLNVFQQLVDREKEPGLKAQLSVYASDNWDSYFKTIYDKFKFAAAVEMLPATLAYSGRQLYLAKHEDLGVALAATYPCYTVWAKIGKELAKIVDLNVRPDHPYKEFIEMAQDYSQLSEFSNLVDGYFERLKDQPSLKNKMIEAYIGSVEYEYQFAESNYKSGPESIPPPQFSNLVELISPDLQEQVVSHPLYKEIGAGVLFLEKYQSLIQQDHIYLHAFYQAYQIMEAKERNPDLKALLRRDPTIRYKWMEEQYQIYGFSPADRPKIFTSEYMDHLISRAECGNIAEGLAAIYPCYFLWYKLCRQISVVASGIEGHPFPMFVRLNDPSNSKKFAKMNSLINGYFSRLGDDIEGKLKMFEAVRKSINYEFLFANGCFEFN